MGVVLVGVQALINESSHYSQLWELSCKVGSTFWAGNKIQKKDVILRDTMTSQDFYRHEC